MLPLPTKLFVPLQSVMAMFALIAFALWPPESGNMLLVSITGADANSVAMVALAGGAMLLGAGPLSGSLVVRGNRSNIERRIRSWDILILAATPALCGASVAPGQQP